MARPRCSKSSPVLATISRLGGIGHVGEAERELGAAAPPPEEGDDHRNRSCRRRADQGGGGRVRGRPGEAAQQHGGLAFRPLALHQRGGGGDFVGEADLGDFQGAAEQIGRAAQIDERGQAGGADRDAGAAAAPGAAETVGDDDGEADAEARHQRGAQGGGGSVRVFRQQQDLLGRAGGGEVGVVDAGIGHHEAEPVFHDQQVGAVADDADRFRTG